MIIENKTLNLEIILQKIRTFTPHFDKLRKDIKSYCTFKK